MSVCIPLVLGDWNLSAEDRPASYVRHLLCSGECFFLICCFLLSVVRVLLRFFFFFFFFTDTATPEIYTLSLHDALPICATEPVLMSAYFAGNSKVIAARGTSIYEAASGSGSWTSIDSGRSNAIRYSFDRYNLSGRSEERRVGKECRSRLSPHH